MLLFLVEIIHDSLSWMHSLALKSLDWKLDLIFGVMGLSL